MPPLGLSFCQFSEVRSFTFQTFPPSGWLSCPLAVRDSMRGAEALNEKHIRRSIELSSVRDTTPAHRYDGAGRRPGPCGPEARVDHYLGEGAGGLRRRGRDRAEVRRCEVAPQGGSPTAGGRGVPRGACVCVCVWLRCKNYHDRTRHTPSCLEHSTRRRNLGGKRM